MDQQQQPRERTREEIEQLKAEWRCDPIWDIEVTPGYELHYQELLDYHNEQRKLWEKDDKRRVEEEQARAWAWAKELDINASTNMILFLYRTQQKMNRMDHHLRELYNMISRQYPEQELSRYDG